MHNFNLVTLLCSCFIYLICLQILLWYYIY